MQNSSTASENVSPIQKTINDKLEISLCLGGAKAWYGLQMRPYSIGAQPKDSSVFLDNEQARVMFSNVENERTIRHGALAYPEELSLKEIASYELVLLDTELKKEIVPPEEAEDLLHDFLDEYTPKMLDKWDMVFGDEKPRGAHLQFISPDEQLGAGNTISIFLTVNVREHNKFDVKDAEGKELFSGRLSANVLNRILVSEYQSALENNKPEKTATKAPRPSFTR